MRLRRHDAEIPFSLAAAIKAARGRRITAGVAGAALIESPETRQAVLPRALSAAATDLLSRTVDELLEVAIIAN